MANTESKKQRIFIDKMVAGQFIEDQVFLIGSKDLRTTSNGSLYIHCVLCDKSGQMLARVWQASESMFTQMPEGGFMRFKGRVENYKGSLQFIIDAMRPVDPTTVEFSEFLPHTSRDIGQMFDRVKEILRTIKNPHVLNLVKQFIVDEERMRKFCKAPAAIANHQAYLGGLLEHTLNIMELTLVTVPKYPELSMDLMLAGVFLHDMGKTEELTYETNFQYSDCGQLVGHLVQATLWIEEKVREVETETGEPFPKDIKEALQHIVLSHHGAYEFGSPKLPCMPEAVALHYLDNLDAKLNMYLDKIASDANADNNWTEYVRNLATRIYKKDVLGIREA
jgi:3'-5' exoribonuclease